MEKTLEGITITAELSIGKPVAEVFEAVLNPIPYFLKKAGGPLKEGSMVIWEFAELPKGFPVTGRQIVPNQLIRFTWPRDERAVNTVEFTFKPFNEKTTTVFISESGWPDDAQGRAASYRNCMGWTHMLCSLKAWLEYHVNLRTGSFVHMKFE